MRIGVFGGSFDPIHHGHLIAAEALADALNLDEVRLVVAGRHPFKGERHSAAAEDRAAMVELAVQGSPRLMADRSEVDRPGPSYTVDTLRGLRAGRAGAELVLLLGADAAAGFGEWKEPEQIRTLARVTIFAREGVDPEALAVPRVDISSTAVRARVREGRSIRYWVPEAVAEYIARRRLYRED